MRLLRSYLTNITKRRYAKVHDVQIKFVQEKEAQITMEKNGYCEAPRSDAGNHSVAGIVTNEFLDFSAARGNDLRGAGLSDGCKWCLCVARWKEAFDARSGDDDRKVPKVVLSATNKRALEGVTMEELRKFAAEEKK